MVEDMKVEEVKDEEDGDGEGEETLNAHSRRAG